MTKKKSPRRKSRPGATSIFQLLIRSTITQQIKSHPSLGVIWGLFCVLFSFFLWIAITTHNAQDPSFFRYSIPKSNEIYNKSGFFGAYISGLLFFLFGFLSWVVPLPLACYSIKKLTRNRVLIFTKAHFLGFILLFFTLLVTIPIYLKYFSITYLKIPSTGVIGSYLFSKFHQFFGEIGFQVFLLFLFSCSILLLFSNKLSILSTNFKLGAAKIFSSFKSNDQLNPTKSQLACTPTTNIPNEKQNSENIRDISPLPIYESNLENENSEHASTLKLPIILADSSSKVDNTSYNPAENTHIFASVYKFPSVDLLNKSPQPTQNITKSHMADIKILCEKLEQTLKDFGVKGQTLGFHSGPVVTIIEYQPDPGIKQSKILSLADDIALALKVDSIMIQPLKSKSALGIQVPNVLREKVCLGDILSHNTFRESKLPLTFGLGKTIHGEPVLADLASMPHLLIAGSTGSGKSVGVNAILSSLILKSPPWQVKMILVDPKMLELSVYEGIPHLLMPVITDPNKASLALKWAIMEMEKRYKLMQICAVRNIDSFNDFWAKTPLQDKKAIIDKVNIEQNASHESLLMQGMPYLVVVIDELADLMMTAPKEVEVSIQRLAQKARASGIHMVLATQRPSVDIITGVIKANLPCRIAYQVVSKHDSRTILDSVGAEKLLGKGDLLMQKPGTSRLERLQGALITDEEVTKLVTTVKAQEPKSKYCHEIIEWIEEQHNLNNDSSEHSEEDFSDSKYFEALNIAQSQGNISASYLQRQLKIGYNRAARLIEHMEKEGLVEKSDGVKPRKWLNKNNSMGFNS